MTRSLAEPHESVAYALRKQAGWCAALGSPLYAVILDAAARDAESRGVVSDILGRYAHDALASALALRFLAAVHRLALHGDAPGLAARYPSCGGDGDTAAAWRAFHDVLFERFEEIQAGANVGVQTNEVNRSAALLAGFLTVAQHTKLPLRIFEVGASAGLNLRWDRFRYVAGGWTWGPPDARVILSGFRNPPIFTAFPIRIVERRGCDRNPIDPTIATGRELLTSFVWPDQTARIAQLQHACEIATTVPIEVERSDAAPWLESGRIDVVSETATIVFHSVMIQYLAKAERDRLLLAIEALASRATKAAPFAHLCMEPPEFGATLTLWPGRESKVVARSSAHGSDVEFL